jgi:23S rRNA pseudouridine1911/1915/1917 synthase
VSNPRLVFDFDSPVSQRLDKYLVTCLPEYSRTRLQTLIEDGHVLVNGVVPGKSGMMVEAPSRIEIEIPPTQPSKLTPEELPLDLIFENEDLLVINKPAGMVVHPSAGHYSGTLVHAALAYAPDIEGVGGEQRPGVVHRLDKDTSGLILMAKNDRMHLWLQDQFRQRTIKKTYLALVDGFPPTPTGRIEAPIGRDMSHRQKMAITTPEKGRDAVTEYFTIKRFNRHTYLEAHPFTGRTHQIRVHLAFINCPIVGDRLYGHKNPSTPISRQFLHAARLQVLLPGEETPRIFEAPLPADLEKVLNQI